MLLGVILPVVLLGSYEIYAWYGRNIAIKHHITQKNSTINWCVILD